MGVFDDNIGALLVGQMLTCVLYGLGTLQTYYYYMTFPRDRKETKIWVGLIWAIDTTNVAFVCHGIYLLIQGDNLPNTDNPITDGGKRSFDISAGFNVLVAILVQCFFVKRIFQLCDQWIRCWVLGVLSVLVSAHFALGSMAVVKVIQALSVSERRPLSTLTLSAIVPYTLAAVISDISIAVALVLLLRTKRSGLQTLNSIVNRAITFSLTRCVLVSVVAVVRMVTFIAIPQTLWFVATDFMMGKLYANSLLSMLNARRPQTTYSVEQPTGSSDDTAVFTTVLEMSPAGNGNTTHSRIPTTVSLPQILEDPEMQLEEGLDKEPGHLSPHYVPTIMTGR